jgi:hypothetical protein
MAASKVPVAIISLVQPSVTALAAQLFVLSTFRKGSAKHKPTISSFYETGIITSLYEHLLMSPRLAHLEIRHEMPYQGPKGAPKRVDLWIRPPNGGYPHLIEGGDFGVGKVHTDLGKINALNPKGSNWFLALFRGQDKGAQDPKTRIDKSFAHKAGLDPTRVSFDKRLCAQFEVYSPDGEHFPFAAALLRGK